MAVATRRRVLYSYVARPLLRAPYRGHTGNGYAARGGGAGDARSPRQRQARGSRACLKRLCFKISIAWPRKQHSTSPLRLSPPFLSHVFAPPFHKYDIENHMPLTSYHFSLSEGRGWHRAFQITARTISYHICKSHNDARTYARGGGTSLASPPRWPPLVTSLAERLLKLAHYQCVGRRRLQLGARGLAMPPLPPHHLQP